MEHMDTDPLATTITRALSEAALASIEAATEAYHAGRIAQREIAPGVWVLTNKGSN